MPRKKKKTAISNLRAAEVRSAPGWVPPSELEVLAARCYVNPRNPDDAGAWTAAQLAEWGIPWPPPEGWRHELRALWLIHQRKG